jgi:hypothetical protein
MGLTEKSVPYNTVNCCTVGPNGLNILGKETGFAAFRIVSARKYNSAFWEECAILLK